jgi:hypothetical protein
MDPEGSLPWSQKPATVPIQSHMNPVHSLRPYSFKIHFNIILPSMSRTSVWSPPFRPSIQELVLIFLLPHACYTPCPPNTPSFDYPYNRACLVKSANY